MSTIPHEQALGYNPVLPPSTGSDIRATQGKHRSHAEIGHDTQGKDMIWYGKPTLASGTITMVPVPVLRSICSLCFILIHWQGSMIQ